ncbi:hypothetical protein [Herbiconiux solani]|uniref:hypothetical protein n=1 Tax=Herbiconiux solani TaxID=661329 RepID=UPI000826FE36|nr:hypothetical protein [Herbiconiux solani]
MDMHDRGWRRARRSTRAAIALAVVVLVGVTGCAGDGVGTSPTSGAATAAAGATRGSPAAGPEAGAGAGTPADASTPSPATDSGSAGQIIADLGPRPGATGQVLADGGGEITTYLPATGDTLSAIAARFAVDAGDLLRQDGTHFAETGTPVTPNDLVLFEDARASGSGGSGGSAAALVDGGPREHAQGEAILDASGALIRYVIADGDRGDEIGQRFGTDARHIYHDSGDFEGRDILAWGPTLQPGDVVRFVP